MSVYVCVRGWVCMYIYMYVCIYAYTYIYIDVCTEGVALFGGRNQLCLSNAIPYKSLDKLMEDHANVFEIYS